MNDATLRTANKGEWSELYALFKILSDRKIAAAGPDLQPLPGVEYDFLKIIREETKGKVLEYDLQQDGIVNILDQDGSTIKSISTDGLRNKAAKIFEAIKAAGQSSFELEDISELMDEYLVTKVKANSLEKTDILATVANRIQQTNAELGFSVKSYAGGLPSLVNPSGHTNFIYEVIGFDGDIDTINAISGSGKVQKRVAAIYADGGKLKFTHISSPSFNSNLRFSDANFPMIMAQMLLDYYSGKGSKWPGLVELATSHTGLDVTANELIYKLKGFLRSVALGMVPSKEWDTNLKTYGGYIVVLKDGRIVCYHLFNDDEFKEYLFKNTKFDTPSTTKFKFGKLYREDGKLMIKLNLQIRFLNQ